jgi:GNAT superfamily N-acetyltransferase
MQMTLRYGWESFRLLLDEPNLSDLLRGHWEELGVHKDRMPLDPDFARFVQLEDAGLFRVWTARDGKTLAGYLAFFIQPHLHYKSTPTATEDLFLLAPAYRQGLNGVRLFTTAFDALRELGVKRIICHSKVHFEAERGGLDKLFAHLGFEHTDRIWSRML